jgi:MraZ protein
MRRSRHIDQAPARLPAVFPPPGLGIPSRANRSARAWQRIFLGNASDVEMDSAGRILIAPELRAAAGLSRDVMLLGMGSHFEIWDAAKLADSESTAIASGMPDVLNNFSF